MVNLNSQNEMRNWKDVLNKALRYFLAFEGLSWEWLKTRVSLGSKRHCLLSVLLHCCLQNELNTDVKRGVRFSVSTKHSWSTQKLASYDKDFFLIGGIYPLSCLHCASTCFVFRVLRANALHTGFVYFTFREKVQESLRCFLLLLGYVRKPEK